MDLLSYYTLYTTITNSKELILLVFLLTILVVELISIADKKALKQSYKTNLSLFFTNGIVASIFLLLYPKINNTNITLLQGILFFVVIDLMLYGWHRLCHTYDFLWTFHRVHHSDKVMNTTTSFRVHTLELLLTNLFKFCIAILIGVDQLLMSFNELIATLFVMFHHSGFKLYGEKILNKFIITPGLHKVHHSKERTEHDNNYGTILSVWDRVFGSYLYTEPSVIGIKAESPGDVLGLLKFGVGQWIHPTPKPVYNVSFDEMVAKAAYYRAMKRGFTPGDDQYDWFLAEQDVRKMLAN